MVYKQTEWTEESLLALTTEDDRFDRKAGSIFLKDYQAKIAKAASAFANSNGGFIIVGMYDDKEAEKNGGIFFDGVDFKPKRASFAEWLEDQISNMLIPPIQSYRVLPVIPNSSNSQIPVDKPVYVIEIEASEIAPHQTSSDKIYYYREGNDSKPANHYYLEGLRSVRRFVSPVLVRAWLDTFLTSLNGFFKAAVDYYQNRDFFPVINEITIQHINEVSIQSNNSFLDNILTQLNAVQFVRRYPHFKTEFDKYKKLIERFNVEANSLRDIIAASAELNTFLFSYFTTGSDFTELLRMIGFSDDSNLLADRINRLFEVFYLHPSSSREMLLNKLGTVAVYEILGSTLLSSKTPGLEAISSGMNFVRAWDKVRSRFFDITVQNNAISQAIEICKATLVEIQHHTTELSSNLDNEIDLLTSRSGVPYEGVRNR